MLTVSVAGAIAGFGRGLWAGVWLAGCRGG
jgi:hypothetical protein